MIAVQIVPIVQAVPTPSYFSPATRGRPSGGLNDLNYLNGLNGC
jgi:hypothetical protein